MNGLQRFPSKFNINRSGFSKVIRQKRPSFFSFLETIQNMSIFCVLHVYISGMCACRISFRLHALLTCWTSCRVWGERAVSQQSPTVQNVRWWLKVNTHWPHDAHVPKTTTTSPSNQFDLDLKTAAEPQGAHYDWLTARSDAASMWWTSHLGRDTRRSTTGP